MKRVIRVKAPGISIVATLESNGDLSAEEMQRARDSFADDLMRAAADVPYFTSPLCRVVVTK